MFSDPFFEIDIQFFFYFSLSNAFWNWSFNGHNFFYFSFISSWSILSFRVSHSAKVNIYGLPFIREMPKITGISGTDLIVKCPVAGYPIDKIHWERGMCVLFNRNVDLCFIF